VRRAWLSLALPFACLVPARVGEAQAAPPAQVAPRTGPSVREVVRMALKAARHIDPARVEVLVRRARLAGLMPTLKLATDRGLKQDQSSSSSIEVERLATAIADDLSFEAAVSFDLSRLVFAPEEVRLLSVQRWLAGDQRKLTEEVVRLYFRRRKLVESAKEPEEDAEERLLAIAEIEALLDALTDGAYGRALSMKRGS
jgi:hypothetical protein